MNFHKQALERGWRNHENSWLDEATTQAIDKIRVEYIAGTYKGNAEAAVTGLLVAAFAAGNAGQGCPAAVHAKHKDDPKATCTSRWWAFWILCVCREMVWYDFAALTDAEKKAKRENQATITQVS